MTATADHTLSEYQWDVQAEKFFIYFQEKVAHYGFKNSFCLF